MFVQRNDVRSIKTYFQDRLKEQFSPSEIKLIVRECVCRRLGLSFSDYILADDHLLSESDLLYFRSIVKRLLANEPFQYIMGQTVFGGLELIVAPGVLIPRPETEELVDWVQQEYSGIHKLNVLDVCSGSGCIAFALESQLEAAEITAMEISTEAIAVFDKNKIALSSLIRIIKGDALESIVWDRITEESLDLVISNPPYITEMEASEMEQNVLSYEPHIALFVSADDPILFYREIIRLGVPKLKSGGRLFFELNPMYATEVIQLMEEANLVNITLRKDLQGKDRMLMGQKP